jgi:TolB-like protein/class 3 adenylate cyclase
MKQPVERKLAAILAADVAGYSRLMGADEEDTHERLKAHFTQLLDPKIREHRGRTVKNTGDGLLAEFASVVDAVRCAVEVQRAMAERNAEVPAAKRIEFRFGIHQGDIIVEEGDIFGDGVNLAARLEGLAEPGGICVSGRVRADAAGKVDVAFDDLGEQSLKNIARPLRVFAVRIGAGAKIMSVEKLPLPLPDKPSIAVLPFQNMSGDPEQEYFADGMVEDIITALSRIRWLFVIARNSSFTYKGQAIDVKQVGRELGVRYVLEGSVRKAGGRVRITAQLIDATNGAHLWADRFDGALEDVFELQDNVASNVAGVIEPALQGAEMSRSAQRPTNNLTAYDLYLRALTPFQSGEVGRESYVAALDLLNQAIERDPRYAPALALAGSCRSSLDVAGWVDDAGANRDEALRLTRRALAAARDDPNVLAYGAYVLAYFGEDIVAAIALIDRSLELNPSFAVGWWRSGWLRLWAGHPDLAIEHFETGLRLSPRVRMHDPFLGIGVGHFFARRYDEARTMLLRSMQENPNWVPAYRFLASCYAHMGRLGEARDIVTRLRAMTPVVVPSAAHWRNPDHRELYLSGLRLAAGETT